MSVYAAALLAGCLAADPNQVFTVPPPTSRATYGHGLTAAEAQAGWISLFDGRTSFGWQGAQVANGTIRGGETTGTFGSCELQADAIAGGAIHIGASVVEVPPGAFQRSFDGASGRIRLGDGLKLRSLALRPTRVAPVFNGRDLSGWTIIRHPALPENRQTNWTAEVGVIRAMGGPGALELEGLYRDFVLQAQVRTRATLVNGGIFLRAVPGDFLNGYEAQIFNACYERDPERPARYSTGAIDDRQLARRLVSRDLEPFTLTVVVTGPHIATWVNGAQMTGWTDTREMHENPRQGLRLEAGAIQLQAHDAQSDLEFSEIRVAELPQTR